MRSGVRVLLVGGDDPGAGGKPKRYGLDTRAPDAILKATDKIGEAEVVEDGDNEARSMRLGIRPHRCNVTLKAIEVTQPQTLVTRRWAQHVPQAQQADARSDPATPRETVIVCGVRIVRAYRVHDHIGAQISPPHSGRPYIDHFIANECRVS
jgi:hypothetical protein